MTRDARLARAVRMTIGTAVVFLASFLPWHGVQGAKEFVGVLGGDPLVGISYSDGWRGATAVGQILFPHWIVVPIAVLLAGVAWLEWFLRRDAPRRYLVPLALFGLAYSLWVIFEAGSALRGLVGIGALLAASAFAYLLWQAARRMVVSQVCWARGSEEAPAHHPRTAGAGGAAGARAPAGRSSDPPVDGRTG